MMDYYVRPRHLYLHSRTCTRSGLCRRLSILVASLICYLLDRQCSWDFSSRDFIPVYVRYFQPLWRSWSVISSAIMEIMVLYISSSWRFWSMYIVHGDDHTCHILYHAYSCPLYSYVSRTTICIWSYMQSCIIVLWWLGGWSSIWDSSLLHFWDGIIMYFIHRMTPLTSHIRGYFL